MLVKNLCCESLESPLGVDVENPRFSWILSPSDGKRGKYQTAYRILVASSQEDIAKNNGDLWDSGKVASDSSAFVEYSANNLKSRMKCFWKVKVWDEAGKESDWSPVSTWSMGILSKDWQGEWIGERIAVPFEERFPVTKELEDCPDWIRSAARREHPHGSGPENDYAQAIYLRKEFKIANTSERVVDRAIIRIAGLGYHEVYINGEKVSDHVLSPGATDYTKSVLYVTHDITTQLNAGDNCIGVILGNGWYWVGTPDLFGFDKADWAAPPKCRLELEIRYKDGNSDFVHTDGTWICTRDGPIRFNCIRSGEVYDARMELGEWSRSGVVKPGDSKWKTAAMVPAPKGILRSQLMPPIRVNDSFGPCNRVLLKSGAIVYWFPKNNAGWVRIRVKGTKGQTIKLELNEKLRPDGSVDMETHSGHTYGRYQTCEYICKGEGIETYSPRFCYAGFQYVQVIGASTDQIVEILAHQVSTSFTSSGEFACSDLLINSINAAAKSTFMNGYHSYPQDCPQREKAGWTEDALLSAHGSIYNYNALLAYKKWIRDLMDAQHEGSGQVPDIVPTPLWGKPTKVIGNELMLQWNQFYVGNMADPWWGGTLVMLPWRIYRHYGDISILKEAYPAMKKYVDFLLKTTQMADKEYSYMINWQTMLGDWLEVGAAGGANRTPKVLTCSQGFYRCATVVANVAALLHNKEEESHYRGIAAKIAAAVNEEFLDHTTGLYCKDSQSAPAMALVLGMVPKELHEKVFGQLVKNVVETHKTHLTTGIVGTYFLYKALAENGRPELAFQVITAKGFPGFEYNLTRVDEKTPIASTTLWEDWGGVSSLAHPVQGTVSSFFYEYLAGIRTQKTHSGFKTFNIAPAVVDSLLWVKASLKTLYGTIVSNWSKKDKTLLMECEVPVNTTAEILVPCPDSTQIQLGNSPLIAGNGIEKISSGKNGTILTVGSGRYLITAPLKK